MKRGETITLKLRVPSTTAVPTVILIHCLKKISSAVGAELTVTGR